MQLDLFTMFRKGRRVAQRNENPMGYRSEPKTAEEIREIFREVRAAKVARAESSHEASRLDRELHFTIFRNIPFKSWTLF